MKLKFYLRGLGIGVLVTAIILHFILGNPKPMSDEEVKARAKELGMTESLTLSEASKLNDNNNTDDGDNKSGADTVSADFALEKESASPSATPSPSASPSPSISPSPSASPTPDDSEDGDKRMISITVSGGDGSYAVAKKVASAGLVESAAVFDEYLCNNGYDKILNTGTHKIPEGSSYEEIAKYLCGRL